MNEIYDYHSQLKALLVAQFASLQTVTDYCVGETLATPAILIEVESMQMGGLKSDGKTPLVLSVALHCVLGHTTPNLELELRNFAGQVMSLMHNQYLDMPDILNAPLNITAMPGDFKKGKAGFDSFVVTYEQTLLVGEGAFDLSGIPCFEVRFNDDEVVIP